MPLPAISISDLSDAGPYDPKDKLQLQRNVLGSWQDFHTNIETYFGPVLTATFAWDGSFGWSENFEELGYIIVPLEMLALFTPGGSPTNQIAQIGMADVGPGATGGFIADFVDTNEAQAVSLYQPAPYLCTTRYGLQLSGNIIGIDPLSGTLQITIYYVKAIPI